MRLGLLSPFRYRWEVARRKVVSASQERALRLVALMLFAQRASYVVAAVAGLWTRGTEFYESTTANVTVLAAAVAWNGWLAVTVWRRGWFTVRLVGLDALISVALLIAVIRNLHPEYVLSAANWAKDFAQATTATAGAALALRHGLPLAAALVTTAGAAITVRTGGLPTPQSGFFEFANSSLWYALALHFLGAQARMVEEATQRRVEVEAARAGDQARFGERLRHFRALHDTVLATLTAIARGGLDHQSDQVRQRCAADAAYIRRLIVDVGEAPAAGLGYRLAQVSADAAKLDLEVHLFAGDLPPLPQPAVDAVADACREALNNVAAHAGTREAWLTADWAEPLLTVRVVDRGAGFDPESTEHGFGLRQSIGERMTEVGGEVRLFSMPGEGTSIELVLPAPPHIAQ